MRAHGMQKMIVRCECNACRRRYCCWLPVDEDFGTSCTGAATGNDTASAPVSEGAKLQFPLLAHTGRNGLGKRLPVAEVEQTKFAPASSSPEFIQAAKQLGGELELATGEELQQAVAENLRSAGERARTDTGNFRAIVIPRSDHC